MHVENNVDFFGLGSLIRMEIATNSSQTSTSNNISGACAHVGGSVLVTGACLCPDGLSSPYDAVITGNFCSIPSQYSDTVNGSASNSSDIPTDTSSVTITMSGVIQLVCSFIGAMLLVCVARKFVRCCRKRKSSVPNNSYTTADQYWYS